MPRRFPIIFLFFLISSGVMGQMGFKAVISDQTIVLGESFQVQYIFEEAEKLSNFLPPDFKGFRVVAGPNTYTGSAVIRNKVRQVKNLVYTLSAISPGHYTISGATANISDQIVHSNSLKVEVISEEEAGRKYQKDDAGNSEYILRPGEDPYDKISKNLFLKVLVNQQTCYVGEPVEATFKLYSRLESKSDIVKNPGFYGFTVYDMINLADKQVTTEKVKGKLFDVHTIRKVQLYPLQSGTYTVDPMEVKNQVEFSRSTVNKKTEQEIVEGVLGTENENVKKDNTETFESDISTSPLVISVKPIPIKNKPDSFNGGTGNFTISARVIREPESKNAEGVFEIAISGKGNFIQLSAPVIQWPDGIEGFEPSMKDSLDKTYTPLTGSRKFHYSFLSPRAGIFTIPPVVFSFFNPDSGSYKTISTKPVQVIVSNAEKKNKTMEIGQAHIRNGNGIIYWLTLGIIAVIGAGGIYLYFRMRDKKRYQISRQPAAYESSFSVDSILATVNQDEKLADPGFYPALRQAIWQFAGHHFDLSGSGSNKQVLEAKLKERNIDDELIAALLQAIRECESGMYALSAAPKDKGLLLLEVRGVLEKINDILSGKA